jgi:hypothetical protein
MQDPEPDAASYPPQHKYTPRSCSRPPPDPPDSPELCPRAHRQPAATTRAGKEEPLNGRPPEPPPPDAAAARRKRAAADATFTKPSLSPGARSHSKQDL